MMTRPPSRWILLVASCAIVAATLFLSWGCRAEKLEHPPAVGAAFSLNDLCQGEWDDGWRILHPPDLPGPYARRLHWTLYYHPANGESVVTLREKSGAVVWEERTRPGVSYRTLDLETATGERALGLLVRQE